MTYEFDGIDELINEFEKLENISEQMKNEALNAGAKVLQREYRNNIYNRIGYDSGISQDSITISKLLNSQIHVGPTTEAFYLKFLENGFYNKMAKRFIPATPIFQPIFLQSRLKVINAMVESARNELNKI